MNKKDCTEIWQRYQRGRDHHNMLGLYAKTERAFNFFEGRQWENGQELPFYNFIQPVVDYKVASICTNNMEIVYSSMNFDALHEKVEGVCKLLNGYAARQWEQLKMDQKMWDINREAAIAGDAYLYFQDSAHATFVDNTAIYFCDEQEPDLQQQKYILIAERRFVSDVKEDAKKAGLSKALVDQIVADADEVGVEVECEEGKCTSILMFERVNGEVAVTRSTRTVVYQPTTVIRGLGLYPVVSLVWDRMKHSCRGVGEVGPMIPNQIETNRTLVRRTEAVKLASYPRMVYDEQKIANMDEMEEAGQRIALQNMAANRISDVIGYLSPAPISSDARILNDELQAMTKTLAGAGDAALGQVNPENASGAAIIAVRDQAMLPLNAQVQAYQQLIEDIARVWLALWVAYSPNGLQVQYFEDGEPVTETVSREVLRRMKIDIRIDVSPANPFSKYAKEQSLENLFRAGAITFEEYVSALDDDAVMPKGKLTTILKGREEHVRTVSSAGDGAEQGPDGSGPDGDQSLQSR